MLRVKARPRAQTRWNLASFTAEDAFFSFSRSTCGITESHFAHGWQASSGPRTRSALVEA